MLITETHPLSVSFHAIGLNFFGIKSKKVNNQGSFELKKASSFHSFFCIYHGNRNSKILYCFCALLHGSRAAHPNHKRLGCAVFVYEGTGIVGCGVPRCGADGEGGCGGAEEGGAEVVCGE